MYLIDVLNNIADIFKLYKLEFITLIAIVLTMIQITPLKINPWSFIGKLFLNLFSLLGRIMMRDLIYKLDQLEKKLNKLSDIIDDNEIDRIRGDIIIFANSCQRGENHTQHEFKRVFKANQKYHAILDRIGKSNGEIDREMSYIDELYKKKEEANSFLK